MCQTEQRFGCTEPSLLVLFFSLFLALRHNILVNQQELELLTQRPGVVKPTQAASAGNGDDDNGEGDITEEQINLIYKKYVQTRIKPFRVLRAW